MFEQSVLVNHNGGRKTATFFASLSAQILAASVLILIPLVYQDTLRIVVAPLQMPLRFVKEPPPPDLRPNKQTLGPTQRGLALPSPFHPLQPTRAITPIPGPVLIGEAPNQPEVVVVPSTTPMPIGPETTITRPRAQEPKMASEPIPDKPVRVSGGVQASKLIKQILPQYPALAVRMRVSGTVHLLGVIAKDGTVQKLQVLSGNPLLTQAALDAVKQWIYSPTLLGGQPVEVEAPIDVIFKIGQ